ncbi:hypothetical protein D9Q98_010620, partial [Chlorella vulgaris]
PSPKPPKPPPAPPLINVKTLPPPPPKPKPKPPAPKPKPRPPPPKPKPKPPPPKPKPKPPPPKPKPKPPPPKPKPRPPPPKPKPKPPPPKPKPRPPPPKPKPRPPSPKPKPRPPPPKPKPRPPPPKPKPRPPPPKPKPRPPPPKPKPKPPPPKGGGTGGGGKPKPPPRKAPPPGTAAMVGDPHWIGFDYKGGPWKLFKGVPGKTYTLYTDGNATKLTVTFGAGGLKGKATFIRALQFSRKGVGSSATLVQVGKKWVLRVLANGKPVAGLQTIKIGGDVIVQATPVKNGQPSGVIISLPYLRIRAAQRAPYLPGQVADPKYGEWLDVYLTILAPLPTPVGGMLGSSYRPPPNGGVMTSSSGEAPFAALVWEQEVV